jgi:cation transport regulator
MIFSDKYRTNIDLPASVSDLLPPHAQDVYRAAFNHVFAAHARRSPTWIKGLRSVAWPESASE